MPTLNLELDELPEAIVVRLSGEAETSAADAVQMQLLTLTARRPAMVVFDLAGVGFMSSLFMGTLLTFQRGLARHSGHVKLAAPQPLVLEALRRARLNELFDISESMQLALESL